MHVTQINMEGGGEEGRRTVSACVCAGGEDERVCLTEVEGC